MTYRIWHTACRIPFTSSGGAGSRSSSSSVVVVVVVAASAVVVVVVVAVIVVVGILRATHLMLHNRSRTQCVHDHISHMAHCMPHTLY